MTPPPQMEEMIPVNINLTYVIGALILSLPAYLTLWVSKRSANAAAAKVQTVKEDLQNSSVTITEEVQKIHAAVNSERAAMLAKIEELHSVILDLSKSAAATAATAVGVIAPSPTMSKKNDSP